MLEIPPVVSFDSLISRGESQEKWKKGDTLGCSCTKCIELEAGFLESSLLIHAEDAGRLGKVLHSTFSRLLGGKGSPHADVLLQDMDVIQIGEVRLKVIHTPGHTPGGICLYSEGHVFTGDTLFVGAVGRTDLPGGSMKQLVTSIHEKIYTLPGDTVVWPGHDYGTTPSSTVQQEKDTNPLTR